MRHVDLVQIIKAIALEEAVRRKKKKADEKTPSTTPNEILLNPEIDTIDQRR